MKELNKKFLLIVSIIMLLILISMGESKATLQANPNTHLKKGDLTLNWIRNVRNMEKTGEALGLSEIINDDLTASSESNGIDMHMMRSTEYGAIAILSASGYGNPQILQESEIKTTTGNKTGVYFSGADWEHTAGGTNEAGHFETIDPMYYDSYTRDINTAKIGDALGNATIKNPGCMGWHLTTAFNWVGQNGTVWFPYVSRGGDGIFGYTKTHTFANGSNPAAGYSTLLAHGVASCGEGL